MTAWHYGKQVGALMLLLSTAVGCGKVSADHELKTDEPKPKVVPVTVAAIEHRAVERTVDVVGSLRGWEQVTVGSKVTGRVMRVYHDMGDHVLPGEPLVELDATDARLGVQEAESNYLGELVKLGLTRKQAEQYVQAYGISEELLHGQVADESIAKVPSVVQVRVAREKALQHLNRQRALTQRGAGTPQELEDAENEYRSAVATHENAIFVARTVIATAVASKVALSKAEQALKEMTIRAPSPRMLPPNFEKKGRIAYGVMRRQVSEGQMIKEGEAIAELVIEDPLRLWSHVPEQYVGQVKVGQPVRVSTRAHPGKTFDGRIVRISPSVDSSNRTFQVETLVPNEKGLLRPGGFAKASIVTDSSAMASVVPIESIVQFAGVTRLFVVENGRARSIDDLKIGEEGLGWAEVSSKTLPASGKVVTTGMSQLADGTMVTIREAEPATAKAATAEATADKNGQPGGETDSAKNTAKTPRG